MPSEECVSEPSEGQGSLCEAPDKAAAFTITRGLCPFRKPGVWAVGTGQLAWLFRFFSSLPEPRRGQRATLHSKFSESRINTCWLIRDHLWPPSRFWSSRGPGRSPLTDFVGNRPGAMASLDVFPLGVAIALTCLLPEQTPCQCAETPWRCQFLKLVAWRT